jgi:hypothetical protein
MSATREQKVLALLAFVVIALPAGFCSVMSTPLFFGILFDRQNWDNTGLITFRA